MGPYTKIAQPNLNKPSELTPFTLPEPSSHPFLALYHLENYSPIFCGIIFSVISFSVISFSVIIFSAIILGVIIFGVIFLASFFGVIPLPVEKLF